MNRNKNKQLKIFHLTRSTDRNTGIGNVVCNLHKEMRSLGYDSKIVTTYNEEADKTTVLLKSCRKAEKNLPKYIGLFVSNILYVPIMSLVGLILITRKNSCVIVHDLALFGHVKILHSVHTVNFVRILRRKILSFFYPLHHLIFLVERLQFGITIKRFVAISSQIKKECLSISNISPSHISIIHNGVDLKRFNSGLRDEVGFSSKYNLKNDTKSLLFVGNEFRRKGLQYVISAIKELEDFVLFVAGKDKISNFLRCLSVEQKKRVIALGHVRNIEFYFANCDAFIFPTLYEAFGLVALEAMSSGCILFANQIGGIKDFLIDGFNGIRIKPNSGDIISKILYIYHENSSDKIEEIRKNAINTANEFSWDKIATKYINFILDIGK